MCPLRPSVRVEASTTDAVTAAPSGHDAWAHARAGLHTLMARSGASRGGMMASEMLVIGVVPRDRLSPFPRCLEALYAHTDTPFRVVLVAGGADHATRQHLQSLQA
jgi:hypothetical protein